MGWYVGVDVGSFSCKVALMLNGQTVGSLAVPSGSDYARSACQATARLLGDHGVRAEAVRATVATGVGASRIDFADSAVGDVVCTARGVAAVFPSVRTIIDVGAQSMWVIWLDEKGRVASFASNEKCATGSGRFLQVIANVLRVRLEDVGPLSLRSKHPVNFTTGCAVFGESEAITRVSEGVAKEDILAGVHRSLAEKAASLLGVRGILGDCAVCGGGALDVGLLRELESQLGRSLHVPESPHVIGAVGAAIQARRLEKTGEADLVSERRRGSPTRPAAPPRRTRRQPLAPGVVDGIPRTVTEKNQRD
jgi:(R)-2-hydroxyacyl-CoA dehydratese activating ATPase